MKRGRFLLALSLGTASLLRGLPAFASGGQIPDTDLDDTLSPLLTPPQLTPQQSGTMVRVLLGSTPTGRYRGRLDHVVMPSGRTEVINTLSLEEYLLGVVPSEMPSAWPAAALQAQAILARTFALRRLKPSHLYDVVAGTSDQCYGGIDVETPAATAAVQATQGSIVLYNGHPAAVAYMSCCGGHTDDSARVWGTPYPYLAGVSDPYCIDAPRRNWTVEVPWSSLAGMLGLDAAEMPATIALADLGPGGRPGELLFDDGKTLPTVGLRQELGSRLPSTFIRSASVSRDNESIVFTGSGSGHGVGLCQWGARGLALTGATAERIVAYYLPSTTLGSSALTG